MIAQIFKAPRIWPNSVTNFKWLLSGFGLGLISATAIYLVAQKDSIVPDTLDSTQEPVTQILHNSAQPEVDHPAKRFDFYDELPRFEVVIPDRNFLNSSRENPATPTKSEHYIIQAGAFTERTDALRVQSSLALLDIPSYIERVTTKDDIFHRVRMGPITDLVTLRALRQQLESAGVEILEVSTRD